jgi:glycosyltransferase involved in cell wall biosynthesis
MTELSVIICTHNPRRDYLSRVLDALRHQNLSKDRWELLLVDNASDVSVSGEWDLSWHAHARHVLETELGLASARKRGILDAKADLLVFVDDDNVLDSDYLSEVVRIKKEWPMLGVWGSGAIVPDFEKLPPGHLKPLLPHLTLRESDRVYWSNVPFCFDALPWGAGLCVRTSVAAEYLQQLDVKSSVRLTGRRGKSLMSGEDIEICYVACNAGSGMGVFPRLRLTHLIPKERIEERYLIDLMECKLMSELLLNFKWRGHVPASTISLRRILSIFKAAILRNGLDRRLYFANLRATMKASRMIDASLGNKVSPEAKVPT